MMTPRFYSVISTSCVYDLFSATSGLCVYKTNVVVKIELFTYLMISFMKESYEFSCINDNILYRKKVNTVACLHSLSILLELWYLTSLSTIFQLYRDGLYQIMLYRVHIDISGI